MQNIRYLIQLSSPLKHQITRVVLTALFFAGLSNIALADWRKDIGTFRIGLVVGDNAEGALAKIEPFRLAIAEKLGINVEIFATKNYTTLINAQAAARIEYAIYSASAYASAWKKCECVEPLVLPKSADGAQSYKSVVISSENGPNTIDDITTATLAALAKTSFAGYKFAAFELGNQGVTLPENIAFENSGELAISNFVKGEQNALIGWSSLIGDPSTGYSRGTLKLIAAQNGGISVPFRVIWSSSAIPHRPHVIRKSLDGEAKSLLRDVLTRMHESDPVAYDSIEPVFSGGFVVARHGQFLPIIAYVEKFEPPIEKVPEQNDQ